MLEIAHRKISENKEFYQSKISCADVFFTRVLPRIDAYCSAKSESKVIMNFNFK